MRYRVQHSTKYSYASPVPLSHNQIRLRPRELPYQSIEFPLITINPEPTIRRLWTDAYGNRTEFFSIEQSHREMVVRSEIFLQREAPDYEMIPERKWEDILDHLNTPTQDVDLEASVYRFDSRYAKQLAEARKYALPSFARNRTILEAVRDLTHRIYTEFEYDPAATQISTPTQEVLVGRKGVCQDFAHLEISCLRSMGLAARYVSGYLLTHAPPGKEKLIGSDASHAWISVYAGNGNWIDFDPTNNLLPAEEHITIGWGRDYADVSPVQGVFIGGGQTVLIVSVDVQKVP